MSESSEAFLINKYSLMPFNELSEYIARCFEYLETPQRHLAYDNKISTSKETYDALIERLESKLTKIENMLFCKNDFESFETFGSLNDLKADFNTLVSYYQVIGEDKTNIEDKIKLKRQKITELLLILLKSLLSENKTALILLNSSESLYKIVDLLIGLSKSSKEVEKVVIDYKIKDFQTLLSDRFQFSNAYVEYIPIVEWNNINKFERNLSHDFGFFLTFGFGNSFDKKVFKTSRRHWKQLFKDIDSEIRNVSSVGKSTNSNSLELKKQLHRVFVFKHWDGNLIEENIDIIKEICSAKNFEKQINKLLELEKSVSNFLNKQNIDTEAINTLFDEYKSKRNEYLPYINKNLKILLENIISRLNFEVEKFIQLEGVGSDLDFAKIGINNLKKSKNRIFADSKQKMIIKEIFWDLLPQGEWKTGGLIKTFKSYGWSEDEIDESRLTQIIKILKPTVCYMGKEKFRGYVVFGFDSTEKVVLECRKYGNAIYIIKENWQEITKLSKWEARQLSQVTVIRHSDNWFERLKENLQSRY